MIKIPLISFFSGGGFLDLGFERAGFDIVWTNEVKESFADMYEAGITSWRRALDNNATRATISVRDDIQKLKSKQILRQAFGTTHPSLFGVIGGPPCPDFSPTGSNQGVDGDRGKLTQVFVDLLQDLRPSFFVMENVPGLLQKRHKWYFEKIITQLQYGNKGYITAYKILSALELGIPQDRHRVFFIGIRKDFVPKLSTHIELIGKDFDWFKWPQPIYNDAKNLPWPTIAPFGSSNIDKPVDIPLELTVYPLLANGVAELPNGDEGFQPYSPKFQTIAEGDVAGKSFKRLHRYRYSPTAWYGNNEVHLHPWKPRRLTVREALRIQTVPDEYVLPQEQTLTDKFKMIGNGVPSTLAYHLATSVYKSLEKYQIK